MLYLCLTGFFLGLSFLSAYSGTIRGRILDSETRKAVPGAVISILGKNKTVIADSSGHYSIPNLKEGTYKLVVQCMGYGKSEPMEIKLPSDNSSVNNDIYIRPTLNQLGEILVSASPNKETNISARHDEKVSPTIINIISARAIESLPDLNVANILQRISGVSMMKNNSGSNTQLVIRGMSPRYNSTLVDGNVIPTTSGSTRAVPMNIFPSVFVGRIEVLKALTPDMEASGVGGLANIIIKNAPDTAVIAVDLATGYNQFNLEKKFATFNYRAVNFKNPAQLHGADYITSPSDFPTSNLVLKKKQAPPDYNASISYGNRFFRKKLGLLVSGTLQSTYQSTVNSYLGTELNPNNNNLDTVSWNKAELYNRINRKGLIVRLDYSINRNNNLTFSNNYFSLDEIRARHEQDTTSDINKGRLYFGDYTNLDRSSLESLVLHGSHNLSEKLNIDWTLMYSIAGSVSPDFVTVSYNQVIHPNIQPVYLNYSKAVDRLWQWNTQNELASSINVNYRQVIGTHLYGFRFGVLGRDKYLMNNENDYSKDFTTTASYPNPDVVYLFKNNLLTWLNDQQLKGDETYNPANFKAREYIGAAYAMVSTVFGKLQIVTGVRTELTSQSNKHNGLVHGQPSLLSASQFYYDILPSLNLNYILDQKHNFRLSIYQAINRPNISETVPYTSKSANGNSFGNPDLKHTLATCADARFEYYPANEEVFSAGVFYKYLKNPIEEQVNPNNDKKVANAPDATNYGFELVGIKYLGNFGFSLNYTYTRSSMLQPKNWNDPEANGGLGATIQRNERRPLAGQSPNLLNATLIFRSGKAGFNAQITYTMQGKNLVNISSNYGLDSYQLTYDDLGISLDKRIKKHLFLYLKGSNLLNEDVRFQTKNGINTRTLSSKRGFLLGVKFNL